MRDTKALRPSLLLKRRPLWTGARRGRGLAEAGVCRAHQHCSFSPRHSQALNKHTRLRHKPCGPGPVVKHVAPRVAVGPPCLLRGTLVIFRETERSGVTREAVELGFFVSSTPRPPRHTTWPCDTPPFQKCALLPFQSPHSAAATTAQTGNDQNGQVCSHTKS